MEKTRKWRWGVKRWIVLGLIILNVLLVSFVAPSQPNIVVKAEPITSQPLLTIPGLGPLPLTNTLVTTVIIDLVIVAMALAVRGAVSSGKLVPTGISGAVEALIEFGYNFTESTAGKYTRKIFPWFATIFIIVLVANMIKLVPGFETIGILEHAEKNGHPIQAIGGGWSNVLAAKSPEGQPSYVLVPFLRSPSTDLNFTAAIALIAVVMTQFIGVQTQGLRYFSKFFNFTTMFKKPFFGFMDFLVGILELISELAKVLSFAFRLFGNMFAGMVLVALVASMLPWFFPSMILMFEFFIGLIQAFVFGMLTLVFMSQATRGHSEEEHSNEAH